MDDSDMRVDRRVRRSVRDVAREAFVSGLAVVVPLIITAVVLATGLRYVHSYLAFFAKNAPITGKTQAVPFLGEVKLDVLLVEILTPVVLVLVIFVVGLFVTTTPFGERAVDYFDSFISRIPAIGGIYDSFREMSDVVLESDVRNFRDVKLVEFPHDGAYTLGFVTTETPPQLAEPTRHPDMLTLFLPLAPNPVMGGHLVHVPQDAVIDVDMTVEEGIRAVVTSGVAVADTEGDESGSSLSETDLRNLASDELEDTQVGQNSEKPDATYASERRREAAYRADAADPEAATTPDELAERARERVPQDEPGAARQKSDEGGREPTVPPEEAATRQSSERESTVEPPEETAPDSAVREATSEVPEETTRERDDDAEDR